LTIQIRNHESAGLLTGAALKASFDAFLKNTERLKLPFGF